MKTTERSESWIDPARMVSLRYHKRTRGAVRVTLGPKAKCVLIERRWGKPLVSNDGVTIAKEVTLVDPDENLGAQILREAARGAPQSR